MEKFNIKNINLRNYEPPKIFFVEFDYDDIIKTSGCIENRVDCPEQVLSF